VTPKKGHRCVLWVCFSPFLSLVLFLRCQYQECDFLSEIVILRRRLTVAKEFHIGLYDPAAADLELFCNSWSAEFLGERL